MSKIINAIGNKIDDIRDDIYATYFGVRFGIHLMIMRDVSKGVDDLFRLKRYFIRNYGSFTIWDAKDVIDMLDRVASRNPEIGFELRLVAQGFDLALADEIKKEFGV